MSTETSSDEIDLEESFEHDLLPKKRKWRKKSNLGLNQSRQKKRQKKEERLLKEIGEIVIIKPEPKKETEQNKSDSEPDLNDQNDGVNVSLTDAYSDTVGFEELNGSTAIFVEEEYDRKWDEEEHDIRNHNDTLPIQNSFVETCIAELSNAETIRKLVLAFDQEYLLDHYMELVRGISSGSLECTNIAIQVALELAKLKSLNNSVSMRYRADTKLFWETVLNIGGPRVLRLFSSDKHFGQVISGQSTRSKFNPQDGNYNWAVPHENILRASQTKIPKYVPCGIIPEALDMLDNSQEHIIAVDGKLMGQGLKGTTTGDVDLWGYEGPPSLKQNFERFRNEEQLVKFVQKMIELDDEKLGNEINELPTVLGFISNRIKGLREAKIRIELHRQSIDTKIKRLPFLRDRYELSYSEINAFIIRADSTIETALSINEDITEILSTINGQDKRYKLEDKVDLNQCCNYMTLSEYLQLDQSRDISLIRQREPLWFEKRKQCLVSGSSIFNALGLRSLKEQRKHFKEYVLKEESPTANKEAASAMKYGTDNEINAVATIVSTIMPALFPSCHRFLEVGSYWMRNDTKEDFMLVSPDGIIKCVEQNCDCHSVISVLKGPMVVEIKCPYFGQINKRIAPIHYVPPFYYGGQLLAEMQVTQTNTCLFVSWSPLSTSVITVQNELPVWGHLWKLLQEQYGGHEPIPPKNLHPQVFETKMKLKQFVQNNSKFICEVASKYGKQVNTVEPSVQQRFYGYTERHTQQEPFNLNLEENITYINAVAQSICSRSIVTLKDAYNLERRKSSEILLFVVTDIDRSYDKDKPNAIPVAFALKSKSLKMSILRQMMQDVHSAMNEHNCKVLSYAFDGQWSQLVFRGKNNEPLTMLELQKDIWRKWGKASKDTIVKTLKEYSNINSDDLDEISRTSFIHGGEFQQGNTLVKMSTHMNVDGSTSKFLELSCFGGPLDEQGLLANLHTPSANERPELWNQHYEGNKTLLDYLEIDIQQQSDEEVHVAEDTNHSAPRESPMNDEQDVLTEHFLDAPSSIGENSIENLVSNEEPGQDASEYPDILEPQEINMEDYNAAHFEAVSSDLEDQTSTSIPLPIHLRIINALKGDYYYILEACLMVLLCGKRFNVWQSITCEDLLEEVFKSGDTMNKRLTAPEIDSLLKTISDNFKQGQVKCKPGDLKAVKCNTLATLFAVPHVKTIRKIGRKVQSLLVLCQNCIKDEVPPLVAHVTVAQFMYPILLRQWKHRNPFGVSVQISDEHDYLEFFNYPEVDDDTNETLLSLIDPSHCLTNLRVHATQRGFFGCDKKAFRDVADSNHKIISKAIIEDLHDKQNVPIALRVFSEDVSNEMQNLGWFKEAQMVDKFRNWYNACNERGIELDVRLNYFHDMHKYLMSQLSQGEFPINMTYVNGLPNITFQSILANISTRLQMYMKTSDHSYCQRAASTLAVESEFSDLTSLSRSTGGIPLATNINRYVSKMTQVNAVTTNPDKKFDMKLVKKTNYPSYTAEPKHDKIFKDAQGNVLFRSHSFDRKEVHSINKKKRKDAITFGHAPLSGAMPLRRQHYKINESKIPAMRRFGYE